VGVIACFKIVAFVRSATLPGSESSRDRTPFPHGRRRMRLARIVVANLRRIHCQPQEGDAAG
jgi:hypothetical protein